MPVLDQTTRVVYRTVKRTGCFPNTRWAVGEVWSFPCFKEPLCHASHPFSSPHSPRCYHPTLWQLCCFLLEGRLLPNVTPWVLFSLGEFWEPLAWVLQTRLCILQRRGCFPWTCSIFCFSASHGNAAWCKHSVHLLTWTQGQSWDFGLFDLGKTNFYVTVLPVNSSWTHTEQIHRLEVLRWDYHRTAFWLGFWLLVVVCSLLGFKLNEP